MRHALRTKLGVSGVIVVLALIGLPILLGVGGTSAGDAGAPVAGGAESAGAASASHRQARSTRGGFPFTEFDVFLLAAGGAVLLVVGANADRRRRRAAAVAVPRELEA